jgi:uncharacterized membrane protein YGL010W
MVSGLFNVEKQLVFYGAYHSNKINVLIHIICVPLIVWSFQAIIAPFKLPSFVPAYGYAFNDYLIFDTNYATLMAAIYITYYFLLEPIAALLYIPQLIATLLTATALSERENYKTIAWSVHVICWIAQFIGHGAAEGRAPALLDNLLGAIVLAPFFVHLEVLFALGYRPEMHLRMKNSIGVEIARIRRLEGEKRRRKGQ